MDKPGIKGEPFYLQLDQDWLRKRDELLIDVTGVKLEVVKVYRGTMFRLWWNTWLYWICQLRMYEVKVVERVSDDQTTNTDKP